MQQCSPAMQQLLVPTGTLRVGLYPGSPISIIPDANPAQTKGVSYELGRSFADWLGVPFEPVLFDSNADVLAAAKRAEIDFLLSNATAVRAAYLAFTEPVLLIDLGYLVDASSPIEHIKCVDQPHIRVGVSAGSTSISVLPTLLNKAKVLPVESFKIAAEQLRTGELHAFATNKAILYEIADQLPGSRVLTGNWGCEKIAIGIPLARKSGLAIVQSFVDAMHANHTIQEAARRAGMRGLTKIPTD